MQTGSTHAALSVNKLMISWFGFWIEYIETTNFVENYKNFENIHKKDLNFKNFFYDSEITLRSKFNDEIITGFFKSDFSWHSVPKIKLKKNEDRKSLNINIYRTKQEVFLLLIDRIKFLVKCIFSKK